MSSISSLPIQRHPQRFEPCVTGDIEEVGWFGLINGHLHPNAKDYVPDPERRLLRTLAPHWTNLHDIELDDRWTNFEDHVATHLCGDKRPAFHIWTWIQKNPDKFARSKPDVVSDGRTLKFLLEVPNISKENNTVEFVACKRDGVIYLVRVYSDAFPANITSYRFHRFEQLVTKQSSKNADKIEEGVNNFEYFYSVLGRSIGSTRLLYTQKIDCVDPEKDTPPHNYVTLDLGEDVLRHRGNTFCTWKQQGIDRAIWAKCFLSGSSQALVGLRSHNLLDRCSLMPSTLIRDIESCSQPECFHWNKERNMAFLNGFLEFVRKITVDDYKSSVYGFTVDYGSSFHMISYRANKWDAGTTGFDKNSLFPQSEGDPSP